MDVFISYNRSDPSDKLAEDLAKELAANGISTWFDKQSLKPGEAWAEVMERAVNDADNVLLLIDTRDPSAVQQSEWAAALKAAWGSPNKRLIPLLIGKAELPAFVRSTVPSGQSIQTIRMRNPRRDRQKVIEGLVGILQHKTDVRDVVQNVNTTQEDRAQQQHRLDYLKRAAASFKH